MIPRQLNRTLQASLLGLNLVLLVLLGIQLTESIDLEDSATTTVQLDSARLPDVVDRPLAQLPAYAEVIERPLFSDTRRAPEPEVVTAGNAEPTAANRRNQAQTQFALSGVALTEGQRLAIIEVRPGNNIERVVEGGTIQGWTVSDVQATQVTLNRGGERRILELLVKVPETRQSARPAPVTGTVTPDVSSIPDGPDSSIDIDETEYESFESVEGQIPQNSQMFNRRSRF